MNSPAAKGAYHALRRRVRPLRELTAYVPYSSGSLRQLTDLTYQAVIQTPSWLDELASAAGARRPMCTDVAGFADHVGAEGAGELAARFREHGSDKAGKHDYTPVYAAILRDIGEATAMLEVGLGTNNTDVPSNMGPSGSPGASLRAFRDHLPGCQVFGADVDRRVLFEEERIRTFHVDQTQRASVQALDAVLPEELDLVIDDGLHTPNANLAILVLGLNKVRPGGWIVIEDISPSARPLWSAVAGLLSGADCYLLEAREALMFCVRLGTRSGGTSADPS